MKALPLFPAFALALVSLFTESGALAFEATRDARYSYVKLNLSEVTDDRAMAMTREFNDVLADRLLKILPPSASTEEAIHALDENKPELDKTLAAMRARGQAVAESSGFRAGDLIPNALFVAVGVKLSGSVGAGLGGAISVGVIGIPHFVSRTDLVTREVVNYYDCDWGIFGYPMVAAGAGAGGGARFLVGYGLVWGSLGKPSDFSGWSLGVAGNLEEIGGIHVKVGILKNTSRRGTFNNIYAMASGSAGAAVSGELHGSVARILSGDELASLLFGKDSSKPELSGKETIPAKN